MSQCTNQRQARPRSDNRIEVNKRILIIKKQINETSHGGHSYNI